MEDSTAVAKQALAALATERAAAMADELGRWAAGAGRTLEELEQRTLAAVREFGQALLTGVCAVAAAGARPREQPCGCGGVARYVRHRSARVLTVLGAVSIVRAYSHGPQCRHGHAPLDRQLGYCAGSTSAGLEEVLALLETLTLVRVCPTLARAATERLGEAVQAHEQQTVAAAWGPGTLPTAVAAPPRLYLSMDGVLVQTDQGWREYKLGTLSTTTTRPSRRHPGQDELHAQELSFVGEVTDAATFGQLLWCAAARRGVLDAEEVIVVADGAHWIWTLVAEHFPEATQIVDWYHASQSVWQVAHAVYGEGTPRAKRWAKRRLGALWEGKVEQVLKAFAAHQQRGQVVEEASTSYTNHRQRLRYAEYRARPADRQRLRRERLQTGRHRPPQAGGHALVAPRRARRRRRPHPPQERTLARGARPAPAPPPHLPAPGGLTLSTPAPTPGPPALLRDRGYYIILDAGASGRPCSAIPQHAGGGERQGRLGGAVRWAPAGGARR